MFRAMSPRWALISAVALSSLILASGVPAQESKDEGPQLDIKDPTVYPEFPDAPEDAPTARLRVVFDQVSRSTALSVEPHVPFDFWILAHDVQIALRAWEGRLVTDPRLIILERDVEGLNLGRGDEMRSAFKPVECKSGPSIVLARFRAMVTEPGLTDLVIGLGPVQTRASLDPPVACYLICRPGKDLRPFDTCETCAVVNPVAVQPEVDAQDESPLRDILAPVRGRN